VNPAYISAISVLCGSAIGALASLVTPRLANRHEHEMRRRGQANVRREQIFLEFIDLASNAFVDALVHTSIENPSKLVPLYAAMGKLRLFASEQTVVAAERVMNQVIETYYGPKLELQTKPTMDSSSDILREFSERCRAELQELSSIARPAPRLPEPSKQEVADAPRRAATWTGWIDRRVQSRSTLPNSSGRRAVQATEPENPKDGDRRSRDFSSAAAFRDEALP
jgi:hypothetical protein